LAKLQAKRLIDLSRGSVRLGTVLLKDEELARDLEYGGQQLLLPVARPTFIFIWPTQLSNWRIDQFLTCQLTS